MSADTLSNVMIDFFDGRIVDWQSNGRGKIRGEKVGWNSQSCLPKYFLMKSPSTGIVRRFEEISKNVYKSAHGMIIEILM